jgi:hypothetical protein
VNERVDRGQLGTRIVLDMSELLRRLLRSIGTAGAVENARSELVRDQERSVQASLVVRRVNHGSAPIRAQVVAASDRHPRRPAVARAA